MATIGQQFKAARLAKGISESDAGVATKIMTKTILAMEADDFSVMAAPTYAKGFIKLYAEYLGLNPEPLLAEYSQRHALPLKTPFPAPAPVPKPEPRPQPAPSKPASAPPGPRPVTAAGKPLPVFSNVWKLRWPVRDLRTAAIATAGLIVLLLLAASITNCARRRAAAKPPAAPVPHDAARNLLDEPLPDLYLVEPGKTESSR